jgi:hypothetical protein
LVLYDNSTGNAEYLPLIFYQERLHRSEIAQLGLLDQGAVRIDFTFPLLAQQASQAMMQRGRQLERYVGLIEPDRLTDIVNDNLARIAVLEMILERIANAGVKFAIHVLIQRNE